MFPSNLGATNMTRTLVILRNIGWSDNNAESFGEIKQLSDDEYYDDSPMAVYDESSKDYIVLYYKTASS